MQQVTGTDSLTGETRTDTRSYTYDNLGRQTSATNETGTATYEYDDFSRLIKETDVTGAVKEYTYDENGNRLTFKLTIDDVVQMNATYTYDKLNQLTAVTIGGDTTTYGYDDNGNIVNKTTGALVTTYTYNNGNLLTAMNTTQSLSNLYSYTSTYYLDGNVKRKTEHQHDYTDYTYNNLGQLTSDIAIVFSSERESSYNQYFTYDAYGNRASTDFASATGEIYQTMYQYNANNQLVQEICYDGDTIEMSEPYVTSYSYDANGNQTYKLTENYSDIGYTEEIGLGILGENAPIGGSAHWLMIQQQNMRITRQECVFPRQ